LDRSSFTEEKFRLYCEYQAVIHNDHDKSPDKFRRFLCDSPLLYEDIDYLDSPPPYLPRQYGSYHQLYRVDGDLIGIGVVDILPKCVSSVYFIYSPKWAHVSPGKLSGLREIALAQEMNVYGALGVEYQYMGFYIHTCTKMRYKADFHPSYLLDPEEYTWHDHSIWKPLLDKYAYVSFEHPEHFLGLKSEQGGAQEGPATVSQPMSDEDRGYDDDDKDDESSEGDVDEIYEETGNIPMSLWMDVLLAESIRNDLIDCVPAVMHPRWNEDNFRQLMTSAVEAFGPELSREIIFYP